MLIAIQGACYQRISVVDAIRMETELLESEHVSSKTAKLLLSESAWSVDHNLAESELTSTRKRVEPSILCDMGVVIGRDMIIGAYACQAHRDVFVLQYLSLAYVTRVYALFRFILLPSQTDYYVHGSALKSLLGLNILNLPDFYLLTC